MTGGIKVMLDFKASQDVLITEAQKKRFAGKITQIIITGVGAGNASVSLNPAKSRLDHCMQYVQNIQGQCIIVRFYQQMSLLKNGSHIMRYGMVIIIRSHH